MRRTLARLRAPEPETRRPRFGPRLAATALEAALGPDLQDNVDVLRHADGPPLGLPPHEAAATLAELVADRDREWFYAELADDASRDLMVTLHAFRLLGSPKVRVPLSGGRSLDHTWEVVRGLRQAEGTVDLQFLGWSADRYDLAAIGYPVVLDAHFLNVVSVALEQYTCPEHPHVAVRPGDVVIDGGGCWGDTALALAHKAGPEGRVRTFEFEPANLERLRGNLALNPDLAARVDVDERALWRTSGQQLGAVPFGPGTAIAEGGDLPVPSAAIDDLGLARVDFIKLDIEGAELDALHGAAATLRRDRPRLAISLYHRPEDWTAIPRFLDGLGLGYRFSLGHFTVHAEETVLFAWADA